MVLGTPKRLLRSKPFPAPDEAAGEDLKGLRARGDRPARGELRGGDLT